MYIIIIFNVTVHCPAGTFAGVKAKTCTYCPRGFYQDRDRQGECIRCPLGTYTQEEGMLSLHLGYYLKSSFNFV